jgi:hypothetical protein
MEMFQRTFSVSVTTPLKNQNYSTGKNAEDNRPQGFAEARRQGREEARRAALITDARRALPPVVGALL